MAFREIALAEQEIVRLAPEAKHFTDTIKMLAFRAETALVRCLTLNAVPTEDDGRALVREMLLSSADIVPQAEEQRLLVRVHSLASPRHNHALAKLCETLNSARDSLPRNRPHARLRGPPGCIKYLAHVRSPELAGTAEQAISKRSMRCDGQRPRHCSLQCTRQSGARFATQAHGIAQDGLLLSFLFITMTLIRRLMGLYGSDSVEHYRGR
ncbi:MAG: hypothetical protein MZW92_52205 [Comamonadaceae bacterium]|nr:hypothetical protein [Comamonadaceae bacterium]